MPELTDAQKVLRNDTGKRMAEALEALAGTGGRGLPAGGTDGDVLVKNGTTDYDARWTNTPKLMGSLATINYTSAAETTYYEGDYLVYNGQLYIVTDDTISQGVTLNPGQGGNIEAIQDGGFNELVSRLTPALYMQSIDVGSDRAILITPPDGKRYEYLIFSAWNDRLVLGLASIYISGNAVNWNGLPLLQGSTMTASIESGKLKLTTGQQLWAHVGVISTSKFTLESSAT